MANRAPFVFAPRLMVKVLPVVARDNLVNRGTGV
jgi:hypothetical protein